MKGKVKILFVHHAAGWGGAPINMINIINNLNKSVFEPHVLLLKDSIVKDRLSEKGITYTVCDSFFYRVFYKYMSHSDAGFTQPYRVLKLGRIFISWFLNKYLFAPRLLKQFEFDIVHLNSSVLSDWLYPASRFGKVIYHIQEPISKGHFGLRYNFIRSEVKKYADKVIAISEDNSKRIDLPDRTEVIYNFIEIPRNTIISETAKSLLYVGGAAEIKGIDMLIDAIPYIKKDIIIYMAGYFPKIQPMSILKKVVYRVRYPKGYRLRSRLKKITEFENVKVLGPVPTITGILQKSTLLISPFSVPHFSRPIIEAFAYAKPVIATDVKGMEEIVENRRNGIIVKNKDAKGLADAINALAHNSALVKSMGDNGRKKAIALYGPKNNVSKIEAIYTNLMINE